MEERAKYRVIRKGRGAWILTEADNFSESAGVYVSDIASVASVKGSFGSPLFVLRSGLRAAFLAEQLTQYANPFIHVLFLKQERREESHDGVLRAVE